jgi:hypothetical protein
MQIWHEAQLQRHGVLLSAVRTKCRLGAYDLSKSILCPAVDVSTVPNIIFYDSVFFFITSKYPDLCLDFHSFVCNNELYGTDWNYFTLLLWWFLVRLNRNIC